MSTLNAYQKATILLGGTLLPLLLLFMRAMGYGYVWITLMIGTALVTVLVYVLQNARTD